MTGDKLSVKVHGKIVIMGIGNLLLKDEGIGIHALHALKRENELPENVELVDAGTSTLDALQMFDDLEKLIVIDAVKGGGKPGTIYKFKPNETCSANRATISLHQLGFIEALIIAERLGKAPKDVILIGVEPKEVSSGLELSPEIAGKIPEIIRLVRNMVIQNHHGTSLECTTFSA